MSFKENSILLIYLLHIRYVSEITEEDGVCKGGLVKSKAVMNVFQTEEAFIAERELVRINAKKGDVVAFHCREEDGRPKV